MIVGLIKLLQVTIQLPCALAPLNTLIKTAMFLQRKVYNFGLKDGIQLQIWKLEKEVLRHNLGCRNHSPKYVGHSAAGLN